MPVPAQAGKKPDRRAAHTPGQITRAGLLCRCLLRQAKTNPCAACTSGQIARQSDYADARQSGQKTGSARSAYTWPNNPCRVIMPMPAEAGKNKSARSAYFWPNSSTERLCQCLLRQAKTNPRVACTPGQITRAGLLCQCLLRQAKTNPCAACTSGQIARQSYYAGARQSGQKTRSARSAYFWPNNPCRVIIPRFLPVENSYRL